VSLCPFRCIGLNSHSCSVSLAVVVLHSVTIGAHTVNNLLFDWDTLGLIFAGKSSSNRARPWFHVLAHFEVSLLQATSPSGMTRRSLRSTRIWPTPTPPFRSLSWPAVSKACTEQRSGSCHAVRLLLRDSHHLPFPADHALSRVLIPLRSFAAGASTATDMFIHSLLTFSASFRAAVEAVVPKSPTYVRSS
jgi:hypothetical protein